MNALSNVELYDFPPRSTWLTDKISYAIARKITLPSLPSNPWGSLGHRINGRGQKGVTVVLGEVLAWHYERCIMYEEL